MIRHRRQSIDRAGRSRSWRASWPPAGRSLWPSSSPASTASGVRRSSTSATGSSTLRRRSSRSSRSTRSARTTSRRCSSASALFLARLRRRGRRHRAAPPPRRRHRRDRSVRRHRRVGSGQSAGRGTVARRAAQRRSGRQRGSVPSCSSHRSVLVQPRRRCRGETGATRSAPVPAPLGDGARRPARRRCRGRLDRPLARLERFTAAESRAAVRLPAPPSGSTPCPPPSASTFPA